MIRQGCKFCVCLALLFCVCLALTLPILARAASPLLYFSGPAGDVAHGSEFPVKILLDSDRALNAYSISLSYTTEYLEVVNINNGRSVIDIWQNQPLAKDGKIELNGGSISPFQGQGGELLTVNFRAIKEGAAELSFATPAFYLADGKGTRIAPAVQNFKLSIKEGAAPLVSRLGSDKAPPEIKFLSLVQDPFNPKQKFLGFFAVDPDSGVKETAVRYRSYFFWSGWQPAQNPTAVPVSAWAVDFTATDNGGNVAERILYDWPALGRSLAEMLFIIIAAIVAAPGLAGFRRH